MTLSDVLLQDAVIVLTLLVLEAVLSFDNAAVLAAIVRKLPARDRRKALLYGLVGAYALRTAAILLASFLIRTPFLKVLGGMYLVFLGSKHFVNLARHKKEGHHLPAFQGGLLARFGVPTLVAVIIQIELVDLAFAVDQVVVAVAFTQKVGLIIIASMLGILFLRLAAAYIARVMDWLPSLEHMAYFAVFYVGLKLILLHPFFVQGAVVEGGEVLDGACRIPFIPVQQEVAPGGAPGCEVPTAISIAITLGLFGIPVLVKLLFKWPKSQPGEHEMIAKGMTPPPAGPNVPALAAAHSDVKEAPRYIDGVRQPPRPPAGP